MTTDRNGKLLKNTCNVWCMELSCWQVGTSLRDKKKSVDQARTKQE